MAPQKDKKRFIDQDEIHDFCVNEFLTYWKGVKIVVGDDGLEEFNYDDAKKSDNIFRWGGVGDEYAANKVSWDFCNYDPKKIYDYFEMKAHGYPYERVRTQLNRLKNNTLTAKEKAIHDRIKDRKKNKTVSMLSTNFTLLV